MIHDLASDGVHVRTVLRSPDAVHEGHRELLVGRAVGNHNSPAVVGRLRDHGHPVREERLRIVHQTAALDQLRVPSHLHILAQRHGQIPHTALNQALHVGRNLRHTEPRKVRLPSDRHAQHIRLLLRRRHARLADLGHVVFETLLVQQLPRLVVHEDLHLLREDIDQLHAIAVLTANQLLLILVVVGRGQQLTEDHLRNPDLVLRVFCDVDGLTIILNREAVGVAENVDLLDRICRVLLAQADRMVMGIHEKFIDELVESRIDGDGLGLELVRGVEKHLLLRGLDAADIGVGKGEDVLAVRLALVGCRKVGHFLRVLCWVAQASFRFEKVRWRPR